MIYLVDLFGRVAILVKIWEILGKIKERLDSS